MTLNKHTVFIDPRTSEEAATVSINTARLTTTPSDPVLTVEDLAGLDPAPNATMVGPATIQGTWITQRFSAGVPGARYRVTWNFTTHTGDRLQGFSIQPVV